MRGTSRYIFTQLAGPMLLITASLSGVIWLTQSLRFVEKMVNDGVSVKLFLYFTGLLFPTVLMLILPIALFCAVLYAYNRLSAESELVVLWAAGISTRALAMPAVLLAVIVTLICYVLTLYLMPLSTRTFHDQQTDFRSNLANALLQEGEFNALAPDLTIYIRDRQSNGELLGILVYDTHVPDKATTLMAARGMMVRTKEGPHLVLYDGNRQQLDNERHQLSLLYFARYTLDLNSYAKPAGARWLEPAERYLPSLLWPSGDPNDRQHYWKLVVEGHQRLADPLHVMALALVALATVLGGEFNRRGRSRRLVGAALAALILQISGFGLANLAVRLPVLIPLLYLVPLAFAGSAILLLDWRLSRRLGWAFAGAH